MPQQCRLLARAQVDGEVKPPGYLFTLPDGERGPYKTRIAADVDLGAVFDQAEKVADYFKAIADGRWDEPLFEVISEG
jgi:hypothetical protein